MEKIEQNKYPLKPSELKVKAKLSYDPRESLYAGLDIEEALKTLTGKQKECFELVVIEGLTERQAAAQLGISRSSVQVYLRRAKGALKKYF